MGHSTRLGEASVHTTLPAQDLDRARAFYWDKLGLEPIEETNGGLLYEMPGGSQFFVFETAGKPTGEYTQIGFRIDDLDATAAELQARGVEFEEYGIPGLKSVRGIVDLPGRRAAWLKDSEGNLLGLVQFT